MTNRRAGGQSAPNPGRKGSTGHSGPRKALGAYAEGLAARYLETHGYSLIERNVFLRVGEIDIVAEKDETTVFVEVRSRRRFSTEQEDDGAALESLTHAKRARMRRAAELYLATHPQLPQDGRIDVVAITLSPTGKLLSLALVENAVEGS